MATLLAGAGGVIGGRGEVKSFIQIQPLGLTSVTQSEHGNCSVFFDTMVSRVWLHCWWGRGSQRGVVGNKVYYPHWS